MRAKDVLDLMSFTMVLQRVMRGCGHNDFDLRDVIEPTTKRLIRTMSAAINFYQFKISRMEVYEQLKSENEHFREQHDYLVKANDELQQRINTIKAKRAQEEPDVQKLQEEIETLTKKTSEYHKIQSAFQKRINEIKEKLAEKTALKDQIKVDILTAEKENEKLSQKIVQSPERLRQELERMEYTVSSLRTALVDKQQHLSHLCSQREKMQQTEACAEKGLKLLQAVQDDINKENEVKKGISGIHEKQQEQQVIVSAIQAKIKDLEQQLSFTQEKTPRLISQHRMKMSTVKQQADHRKQELSVLKERASVNEVEKMKVMNEVRSVDETMEASEKQNARELQVVEEQYAKTMDALDEFHVGLGRGLENVLKRD
ncbi:kinetochore protein Nuf2-like isoform X2 [Gigantopelta aegis]|uniref:kinetochore protein Nuf2-like isoform X2 n=1 Tax=Gigantopelta aegis TaxID=1735272 RepID=UPI001B887C56|nr:kinetochore protein Nuf2-like isoform X2 [Gigantopelta aegis]